MRILVATDGSATARLALMEAAELARVTGASAVILTVSHVVDLVAHAPLATLEFTPQERNEEMVLATPDPEAVQAILAEAETIMDAKGIRALGLHVFGDAADRIIDVAEKQGVNLIVVGSHGRTGVKRFLMGSVSEQVVRYAPCSVLVSRGQPITC